MTNAMKIIRAMAIFLFGLTVLDPIGAQVAQTPSRWAQPAVELAGQIAEILGPGQAQLLTIRNLSSIPASDLPAIRNQLEQALKARGVLAGGTESANQIRVTVSENARERLWVAEIEEGNQTQIAMVHVDLTATTMAVSAPERMILRRERIPGVFNRIGGVVEDNPIVAAIEVRGQLVVMYPDRISIFAMGPRGWSELNTFVLDKKLARDPRGVMVADVGGNGFSAWAPGAECVGSYSVPMSGADSGWGLRCHTSDDPWPVYQTGDASSAPALKAFFNSSRNFYTGVVTPSLGVDLPAFYEAGMIPRAAGGAALLLTGIDGKVSVVENSTMKPVAGTRDWGSDFAVVRSGCGAGTQVIASSSGAAATDSLRAFEIPALDAVAASSPLNVDGTVTAIWTAADGKSALAVVRNTANQYEVDRVTALCN
jgi:hypothetical protein